MKGKHKTKWQKMCKDTVSLKEWTHKWWKINVIDKIEFKKLNNN